MEKFIKQLIIIIGFWGVGELISFILGISFPGSIIGMILLTVSLKVGWVSLDSVKGLGDSLVKYMVLFFIPSATGIILAWDIIKIDWLAITVASIASTLIVFGVTALIFNRRGES